MGLTSGEILDVVIICYYVPALALSIFISLRQGLRRSNGWLYILALALVRIVGSILGIAATKDQNKTLAIVASIFSSVGLSMLIQCNIGLLRRINEGIHKDHQTPPRWIDLVGIPIIIAVIFAVIGGTEMGNSKTPSDYSNGQDKFKATGIILLIVLFIVGGLIAMAFMKKFFLPAGEFRLIIAMTLTLPFLLVRIIYILCIAFASSTSTTFNLLQPDVPVEAGMSSFPEFVAVAILLVAGVFAKKSTNVQIVGPPPTYEMSPEQRGKYQTYPDPEGQRPAWQPTAPSHTHNAHHYYDGQATQ